MALRHGGGRVGGTQNAPATTRPFLTTSTTPWCPAALPLARLLYRRVSWPLDPGTQVPWGGPEPRPFTPPPPACVEAPPPLLCIALESVTAYLAVLSPTPGLGPALLL